MSKNLVIVESPAKAKTIEKYLGKDFKVLSSVGHIRKDTKVDVANNFSVTYEIDDGHKKIVNELKKAAKSADTIWLATDEDREGESISWHLLEVLKLPKTTHRITFHEITKTALEHAINNPRTVDMAMVSSQQARQTLDMLVGFDLSGVVRRKVPGAISAGRVQSPALRLVVEREREIEQFSTKSNFKITGTFIKTSSTPSTTTINSPTSTNPKPLSNITTIQSQTDTTTFPAALEKPTPSTETEANSLLDSLKNTSYLVESVNKTEGTKSAPTPFTTATLQIEANSKLGFSAKTTMSAAQGLYQAGYITYHRTDSLNLSAAAIASLADFIASNYGTNYLHTRHFKTKSKGAQEAHEAIRPTNIAAADLGKNPFEKKLYQLIRSRTLATQMAAAKIAKTTVNLKPNTRPDLNFTAKGEIVIFDGFLKVYGKSKDLFLPDLKTGDTLTSQEIIARQTFAKPPARYTEGSLVKKLEELGIGRPSTYASIMSAIQTRGYVIKGESDGEPREIIELVLDNNSTLSRRLTNEKSGATKGKLLPTPSGELVSDFLLDHFNQIVDYNFTADIETKLDLIAEKRLERVKMLEDFYHPFSRLVVKSGNADRYNAARELGIDPKTKKPIFAKIGRNGSFIQLGENEKTSGEKPRFAPLPPKTTVKTITFEQALKQLELPALPRSLGHTADNTELIAANGPFGPYLKAGKYNIPLGKLDPYTINLAAATDLYKQKLDSIIADWGDVAIIRGAYGPYIKGPGRRNNVKIPKDQDPTSITEAVARELLAKNPRAPKPGLTKPTKNMPTAKATAKTPTKSTAKTKTPSKSTTKAKSTSNANTTAKAKSPTAAKSPSKAKTTAKRPLNQNQIQL